MIKRKGELFFFNFYDLLIKESRASQLRPLSQIGDLFSQFGTYQKVIYIFLFPSGVILFMSNNMDII